MPTNQRPIDTWELPPGSVAYQWVQELKQQGQAEGIEKGIEMSIQLIKLLRKGIPFQEIADQFRVSLPQVQRIAQKLAQAGVETK